MLITMASVVVLGSPQSVPKWIQQHDQAHAACETNMRCRRGYKSSSASALRTMDTVEHQVDNAIVK